MVFIDMLLRPPIISSQNVPGTGGAFPLLASNTMGTTTPSHANPSTNPRQGDYGAMHPVNFSGQMAHSRVAQGHQLLQIAGLSKSRQR